MLLPVLALLGALVPVVAAPAASAVASPWEVSVSYPVSQASLRDITCPSSTECIAVGEAVLSSNTSAAVIVATTDAGASWTTEPVPASLGSGFDTGLTTVTCPSTSVCYAFGYSASLAEVILGTTDGGSNWSVQDTIDAFGGTPDITCVSTSDCFALTDPNGGSGSGTILQTLSGGASWTSLPLPPNLPQLTSMTCTSAQNCLVVGGADVLQTSNGGTSWTVQRLGGDPPGQANPFELYGVACASSSACIAVGGSGAQGATSGGVIFTTADAGAVWSGQNVSVATLSTVACTSSLDCFAGGVQGYGAALLGSLDGGTTWTNQNIPGASALTGLSCPGTGVCFAAEDGSSTSQILVGPGAALTPSTTTVSASAASVPPGQAVTFTAAVAPATGSGSPTGTVTVEQGGSTLCTIALSNGTGSCSSAKAPVGTDTVTAAYSGDQDYAASSGSTTLIVQMASLTTIAAVPQNAAAGQQVTYAAWVSPTPGMETGTPTGTVAFAIGTTPVCVATLSNGSGSCTADDAPVGDDVVSGTYSGDEYFSGSSGSTSVTVGGTTTSVSVSSSAVAFQQSVTYSATVAPTAGTGTPSGSVTFSIGPTTLCVATLTGGSGSCSSAGAPLGAQEVAVGSYSGDQSFNASVGTTPLAVGATTTTASVQPGEVPAGGSVQYSATVVPGAGEGTPTGNVTFSFFGMPLCVAPLTAGTASCSSSAAPVGDDDVEANYSGDPQFAEASGLVALVVGPTTTTVTVSATPVPSGQPVSYSATVASSLGSGTPDGGSIVFSTDSGSVPLCTAVVSAGTAQCSASSAPVGSDIVFAAYSGDGPFAPSSGSSTLSVAGSTTTASVQPGPVAFSQSVTYSAQVVPSPGSVADGGSVSFSAGTTSTCSAPVVNGVASCMATSAPAGNDTVTATYSGDAAIGASSGTTSLVVGPTTTAVSVNPSSVPANEDTTYSATVSAALGSGVPTGTVTFSYESYQLCTATLSGGSASCTTVADGTVGPNTIVATYSGDSEFAPSAGSATLTDIKDQTAVTFTSMVDFGQTVFFSAGVNPVGGSYGPLSDGTVAFSAGATTLCTARFVSSFGSYACTATEVPWGTDTITAAFSGDAGYLPSSSSQQLFLGEPTVTTVSVNPAHQLSGKSVTYSVAVSAPGASTVPTGSVAVNVGSTSVCVATLSGGTGSCSATNAPGGTNAASGTYSGDATFGSSIGWTTLIIGVESQTITFSSSPNDPVYGQVYTVSATGGGSGNAVVFTSATNLICKVTGSTVTFLNVGTCTIDANQAGNTLFTKAPQVQQTFAVAKAATALVAKTESATSKTMSATLTRSFDGKPLVSQLVKFSIAGVTKCTAYTNVDGVVTCTFTGTRPAGTPTYVATYAGTTDYVASTGSAPL